MINETANKATNLSDNSALSAPPPSDVKVILYESWRAVGASDQNALSFSEAGGDSLMLMHLVFRLEHFLGRKIPLELLETAMLPDEMLARLVTHFDPLSRAGKPGHDGFQKTVFLLPGIGGDEPRLAMMRNRCSDQLRIIPIKYPGWRDLLNPTQRDFGILVDQIIQQIDASLPHEPVRLIGYSFGCRVTHGVVASLALQGRPVAGPVVLLDGSADNGGPDGLSAIPARSAESAYHAFGFFFLRCLTGSGGMLGFRLIAAIPRRLRYHPWLCFRTLIRLEYFLAVLLLRAIAAQYQPRLVNTKAVLFRSEDNAGAQDESLGWTSFWSNCEVLHVSGDHSTMLDGANLDELSNQLTAVFAN